jgi:hypothetical protein
VGLAQFDRASGSLGTEYTIGGILFFLLYCCLVVGKRSDRKLADYQEREEQKTSKDTAKKLGADIWEKQE